MGPIDAWSTFDMRRRDPERSAATLAYLDCGNEFSQYRDVPNSLSAHGGRPDYAVYQVSTPSSGDLMFL